MYIYTYMHACTYMILVYGKTFGMANVRTENYLPIFLPANYFFL